MIIYDDPSESYVLIGWASGQRKGENNTLDLFIRAKSWVKGHVGSLPNPPDCTF